MKKCIPYIFVFLLLPAISVSQSYLSYNNFYIGAGTSISSYLGGYFGQAYCMRVLSDDYDYYDDYYHSSYNYSYPDYYSDNYYTLWSPIQFSVIMGQNINEFMSIEAQSTFLFHFNGRVDPQFVSGTQGGRDYLDRNDYASLYAVPLSLSIKLKGMDENGSGVFVKFGPAVQYTSESYDRIREYYSYENYYSSHFVFLRNVSKQQWLPGFTFGFGLNYSLSSNTRMETELEYSYFNISPNEKTALALDKAPEAQLFSFATKFYIDF